MENIEFRFWVNFVFFTILFHIIYESSMEFCKTWKTHKMANGMVIRESWMNHEWQSMSGQAWAAQNRFFMIQFHGDTKQYWLIFKIPNYTVFTYYIDTLFRFPFPIYYDFILGSRMSLKPWFIGLNLGKKKTRNCYLFYVTASGKHKKLIMLQGSPLYKNDWQWRFMIFFHPRFKKITTSFLSSWILVWGVLRKLKCSTLGKTYCACCNPLLSFCNIWTILLLLLANNIMW